MEFNKQQLSVINNLRGALLVSAPVGTGKTTVLTERVVKAIEEGMAPSSILCLTFTNRAAEEMRSRIRARLADVDKFNDVYIGTFHGFCAWFLRREARALGLPHDFMIADEMEQQEIFTKSAEKYLGPDFLQKQRISSFIDKLYYNVLYSYFYEKGFVANQPPALDKTWQAIANDYREALNNQNMLDFNDLLCLTVKALYSQPEIAERWAETFQFVQLDEFQDTHLSEYLVVKQLARKHKNICLVGDFEQTIYGWRGSKPKQIASLYSQHFSPVTEVALTENYRSKPELQAIFNRVSGEDDSGQALPAGAKDLVQIKEFYNLEEEIVALTKDLADLKKTQPKARAAVLLRANYQINAVADALEAQGVAYMTVDQYNFFRRQEVRDAYAWLKILFNSHDSESVRRIVQRPAKKVSHDLIVNLDKEGKRAALKSADFLDFSNYRQREPFADLLDTWRLGRMVVIDTETTGTDTAKDDIVQIFALEIRNGQPGERRHWFVKNTKPVGTSYFVHRLTDEFLAEKGEAPAKALKEFTDFVGSDLLIGHNVGFDTAILLENCRRSGITWANGKSYDTLDISRRLVVSYDYKLSTLSKLLNLASATHNAEDDVLACFDLLKYLAPRLVEFSKVREELFAAHSKKFISLAMDIARWKLAANDKRPAQMLAQILDESGLREYYGQDNKSELRLKSLDTLQKIFADRDEGNLSPKDSIRQLLSFGALAKNIDFLGLDDGKVPIVTVHQVKGLEFDRVYMPSLNEGSFPKLLKDSDLEEEKRVFYVGITRAKDSLWLSSCQFNNYGKPQAKSRFLAYFNDLG